MIARLPRLRWEFIAAPSLLITLTTSGWAQIDLPVPPAAVPPPKIPDAQNPVLIRRDERQEEQKKAKEEFKIDQENRSEKQREVRAKQELAEPRPMYGFLEINLVYPKILTTGARKNYTADFATHFNGWARLSPSKPSDVTQAWVGLRVAPFAGSGIQRDHAGRFAFTYFGPGLGIGEIQGRKKTDVSDEAESRSGWLLSTGIAAVSRLTRRDEAVEAGASDFAPTPWAIDAPGVWVEYRYMHVFMGALSGNFILGGQLAQGKTIVYTGVGFAGWL